MQAEEAKDAPVATQTDTDKDGDTNGRGAESSHIDRQAHRQAKSSERREAELYPWKFTEMQKFTDTRKST